MPLPKIPAALRTLGVKIGAAIGLTAALVSVAVGLLVHQHIASDLLGSARRDLDGQLVRDAEDYASGRRLQARLDPTDLPAPVAAAIRHGHRVTYLQHTAHGPVLWAATRVSDRTVLALTTPYTRQTRELAALDDSLLAAGATATALALAAGLGIGVHMGRRATTAARTAERIADGDLEARVPPAGQDEIARLATSVNTMAGALGARLEAERRVTADIAHELRTPVAGLLTAADLLPPSRPTQLVQERADALSRLVEDVLEVARLDAQCTATIIEPCLLSSLAQRAIAGAGVGAQPEAVEVRVLDEEVVETDPRRAERIIANLVLNALRHGSTPVTVEITGRRLTVRDRGSGFPDDLLAVLRTSGPQRFRTGAPERGRGVGLGLTIVVGQARVLGARLRFGNHPEGGAQVVLDLPESPGA